jgi:hypothetical protein
MEDKVTEEKKESSPIEEAKLILEENKKVLLGLQEERKKLESLTANNMLAGTAGGRVEAQSKPETPAEYAQRVMNNKVKLT